MRRVSGVVVALCLAGLALGGCSSAPEDSPPGERPCNEAIGLADLVTQLRLTSGPGASDPDGRIVEALDDLETQLSARAGESAYFSAADYNQSADSFAATIDPLRSAYEDEDDSAHVYAAADYGDAESRYLVTCNT